MRSFTDKPRSLPIKKPKMPHKSFFALKPFSVRLPSGLWYIQLAAFHHVKTPCRQCFSHACTVSKVDISNVLTVRELKSAELSILSQFSMNHLCTRSKPFLKSMLGS